jgi:UDPglucose 6-dehydrogenase
MKPKIGIIGNGYVGSSVIFGFSLHADILVYDKIKEKSINSLEEVLEKSEFVFVAVPTPMNLKTNKFDSSILDNVFRDINNFSGRKKDQIYIIKSTVIPGTVEKLQNQYKDLRIVFSPEFLTERSANLDFINATRIIFGGSDKDTLEVEKMFKVRFPYAKFIRTDTTTAQFIKYMANCFFAVKVSFMNEMKQGADKLNVNWQDAMNGFISDGRIGNSHLDVPGHDGFHGFGGKCFPKDINALIGVYNELDIDPKIMKAAWEKNLEVREKHDWLEIEGAVSKG